MIILVLIFLQGAHSSDEDIDFSKYENCVPKTSFVMANIRIDNSTNLSNSTFHPNESLFKYKCLIFSNSVIPEIPIDLFLGGKSNLTTLYAENVQIVDLNKENFINTPFLQRLFLSSNKLKYLKEEVFSGAPNLIVLNMSNNLLSNFDSTAFNNLHSLEILDLSKNYISNVPYELFQDLKSIVYLNLRKNRFMVRYGIFPEHIKTLDLSFNSIDIHKKFKIFAILKNLQTLLLHGNKIENFDSKVFASSIKFIGLSDNSFPCEMLADIVMEMEKKNIVHVYEHIVKNTSNIRGIKCLE